MKKLISFFVLLFMAFWQLAAQAGLEGFNYQAVLRDNINQPIKNQSITVTFKVSNTPGGTVLYSENQQTSTDALGLFNLIIGENNPNFSNLNWGSNEKYLEVVVDVNGNVIPMGTTRFQAVPYAKYALSAPASQPTGNAGGDLKGTYPNPTVNAIQNQPVSTQTPSNGQVLKWDAANIQWKPDTDIGQNYLAGPGIQINGNQVTNSGDINAADDIINSTSASGDISGTFNNLKVEKIQNKDVSNILPSNGQVLKWDSNLNQWKPDLDNNQTYSAGPGIQINGNQINNTGDLDPTDDITTSSIASGDVSGPFSNLQLNPNSVGSNEIVNGSIKAEDISNGVIPNQLWKAIGNDINNANNGKVIVGNTSGANAGLLNINTTGNSAYDGIYFEGPVTGNAIHLDPIGGTSALGIHPQSIGVLGVDIYSNGASAIKAVTEGNSAPVAELSQVFSIGTQPTLRLKSNAGPLLELETPGAPIYGNIRFKPAPGLGGVPSRWDIIGEPHRNLSFTWTKGTDPQVLEFFEPLTLTSDGRVGINNSIPTGEGALIVNHTIGSVANIVLEQNGNQNPSLRFGPQFDIISEEGSKYGFPGYNYFSIMDRWAGGSGLQPRPFFTYSSKNNATDKRAVIYCDELSIDAISNGGHVSIGGAGVDLKGPTPYIDFAFDGFTDYDGRLIFDGTKKSFNFLTKGKSDYVSIGEAGVDLKGPNPYLDFAINGSTDYNCRVIYNGSNKELRFLNPGQGSYNFYDGPIRALGSISGNYTYAYYARNLIFPYTPLTGSQIGGNVNYSIYADKSVVAEQFNAISDRRIKNIIGRSNSINDLRVLNNLIVTDYTHKDIVTKGTDSKKGFIAQEVEEVFPEAVSKGTDFIPNIYKVAKSVLVDPLSKIIKVTMEDTIQLKAGDIVRLIADKTYEKEIVSVDNHSFTINNWEDDNTKDIFVYGVKVNDFRTVDYDRIFTLNVSATQELLKQVEILKNQNKNLEKCYKLMSEKYLLLEANLTSLINKLEKTNIASSIK